MPEFFPFSNITASATYAIDEHSLKALALSIRAGISPREALLYIAGSKKGKSKRDVEALADMFSSGIAYSDAFSRTQLGKFPLFIQIIKISESNGQIATALEKIVSHLSDAAKTRSQILGLSIYPIIILIITISFLLFALLIIVPNIKDIIRMPGVALNPLTRALLFLSDALLHRSWMIILVSIAMAASIIGAFRLKSLRSYLGMFVLKSPIASSFLESYLFGTYASFIALYIRFRSDIDTVFAMLAETSRIGMVKRELMRVSQSVSKGSQLSEALQSIESDRRTIPQIWILFSSVAERSSSYGEMFDHLSQYHAENLDHYSKIYMKMLEPVLMVGIGVLVGLMAYGILSPLYGLMQHVA